jgi:hypothetical protein
MATGGVANGVTTAGSFATVDRRRQQAPASLPTGGPATDRHVAGRAARGKAGGRRAATRGSALVVMPEPGRRQSNKTKRPVTGRWRT